jgi:hypothetical protein
MSLSEAQPSISDLDMALLIAVEIEYSFYGTLRMVMESTVFENTSDGKNLASAERGFLSEHNGSPLVQSYYFELLAPDFDPAVYAIWEMLADHQIELKGLFELLEREGVGWDSDTPEGVLSRNMTWFFNNESTQSFAGKREFISNMAVFLKTFQASSDYEETQRIAALSTFAKHSCEHDFHGEPEMWTCNKCGAESYLYAVR